MKKLTLILIIITCIASCTTNSDQKKYDLAIENVSLFDSKTKNVSKNKTILINADTIAAVIDASQHSNAITIIEGNGKLVVPGFIDTHIHLHQMLDLTTGIAPEFIDRSYRKKLTEKLLSYGTTTAVDLGISEKWMEETLQWQKKTSPNYPNLYIAGGAMISDLEWNRYVPEHHTVVFNPEDGVKKVQKYARMGVQHIKLYSKLETPEMTAIINEANKSNIQPYAHVDNNIVNIPEAMELGVRDFEHFFTVLPSVLNLKDHREALLKKYNLQRPNHIDDFSATRSFYFQYIKENPELHQRLIELFKKMAEKKVTISTTIHVLGAAAEKTDFFSSFNHFPLREAPELPDYTPANKAKLKEAFSTMMQYLKIAHEMGVTIRIGTDNSEAGQAILSEFLLFHEAGFSIEDILQIATWNGAKAMHIDHLYGTIEKGKKADLVLFDKNPFTNVKNFLAKKTVIKEGKVFMPQNSIQDTVLNLIEKEGISAGVSFLDDNQSNTPEAYEMVEIAYHLFHMGKVDEGKAIVDLIKKDFPKFAPIYHENAINSIGYSLLYAEKFDEAIEIFKLNVEVFPDAANTYDSLGEGYMKNGNKELAIQNYQKSIELNPENQNGIEMLKKLNQKH